MLYISESHVSKDLWLGIFFIIFCFNYWIVYRVYIKNKRFNEILRNKLNLSKFSRRIRAMVGLILFVSLPFITIMFSVFFQQKN